MLTVLLELRGPVAVAHGWQGQGPHDLAWWTGPPLAVLALAAATWLWVRGSRRGPAVSRSRNAAAGGALLVLLVLVSPQMERLSATLAAWHMVQHIGFLVVVAPLLAIARPGPVWARGLPRRAFRKVMGALARRRWPARVMHLTAHPAAIWLLLVGSTWLWHAGTLYDAAVALPPLHVVAHAMLLLPGWAFWRLVVGPGRLSRGMRALLVFAAGTSMSLLAALMTFSTQPWYDAYLVTASARGISPLTDQQVAGALMWVPAGVVHAVAAVWLLVVWLRESEREGLI